MLLKAFKKLNKSLDTIVDGSKDYLPCGFMDQYELSTEVVKSDMKYPFYRATNIKSGELFCVKVIRKSGVPPKTLKRIINEFQVLRQFQHENIVAVKQIFNEEESVYVVYENFEGVSLADKILDSNFFISQDLCKHVLISICKALKHCNDAGVVHRNIRPESILLSSQGQRTIVKLIDFEWSRQLEKECMNENILETKCGLPSYVAPEILMKPSYNYKCDIWSLGVVAYIMLSGGFLPFQGNSGKDMLQQVSAAKWSFKPVNAWRTVSSSGKNLIEHMLEADPSKRFNYDQILAHEFLNNSSFSTHMIKMKSTASRMKMVSRTKPMTI